MFKTFMIAATGVLNLLKKIFLRAKVMKIVLINVSEASIECACHKK